MDKYQKAAALDLIKMAAVAVGVALAFNLAVYLFTLQQILTAGAFALLIYCGYNLFKLRVDQHRTLDEIRERNKQ